jgi:tRNA dimethylallyltransferase
MLIIAGPTASGKSAAAVEVAERIGGEVVSADSVQVYRYFDIGAAKPEPALRARIPHHLIDVADPDEEYTLARYRREAEAAVADIDGRGKIPVVVGGTGLYLKALVEGLSGGVKVAPEAEAAMDAIVADGGNEALYAKAAVVDPTRAALVHPNDLFRVRRIVGVWMTTGKPLSAHLADEPKRPPRDVVYLWLAPPRQLVNARIAARTESMLMAGWRDEVRAILGMGYNDRIKPLRSLGYKTIVAELNGEHPPEETPALIIKETKAFAKRQVTWFRHIADARPIPVAESDDAAAVAQRIVADERLARFPDRR